MHTEMTAKSTLITCTDSKGIPRRMKTPSSESPLNMHCNKQSVS